MADSNKQFESYTEQFIKDFFELHPAAASGIGLHEYDGRISDVSAEGTTKRKEFFFNAFEKLNEISFDGLSLKNKYDYELLQWTIKSTLFDVDEITPHKTNPMYYTFMFGGLDTYLAREYAPFDERLRSINSVIKQVPYVLEQAKINLNRKVSGILCNYAKKFSEGYIGFFENQLFNVINERSHDRTLINEYIKVSSDAVEAFKDYIKFIDESLQKNDDAHRLGVEKYKKMLYYNEQIDIEIDELKKMGQEELNRLLKETNKALDETGLRDKLESIEEDHPTEQNLIHDTRETLKELVDFIREKDVVNLPEELNCIVTEMPPYMNFGFAAMGTAGPFEKSDESFYYVNLPEKDWDEHKKKEWLTLFNYPTLKVISIHEAFPGHYTHFLNSNKYATKLSKIFMSYSYIEGWAHYTEEMMLEYGYGKDDPKIRVAQLLEALIRCCRYMVAIGVHTEKMSIDEGTEFFMKNAFMKETTARQEAERSAFDPGYLNYTLGKICLKKLREKYMAKQNGKASLKEFHNRLVAFGAPTWQIAEKYMLGDGDNLVW